MPSTVVRQPAWGLVPSRLVVGIVFIAHGWLKLHSFGIQGTTKFMGGLGIPVPGVIAVYVIVLEMIGGLALILGGFTRFFAALLAVDMLGAIFFAKRNAGFFGPDGWEFELTLCAACLTLAIVGAGGASIDAALSARRNRS
jgi:putative oxidoreductase